MAMIVTALKAALGDEVVISGDDMDRATSYWDSSPANALALVRPYNTEQVSMSLRICHEHSQPVVTQGGMTNCVESANSGGDEVILSLERMNQIEGIDVIGGTAIVGAGVVLQVLQDTCLEKGLLFPLDLGARGSCTLGGNVATNAGGINVLRYGMARNLVLGMEVVLADGSVLSSMNQMLKNNAGYDLKQLFIGSEGTLGVITRLVLRVFPKPITKHTALVALENFEQVKRLLQIARLELAGTLSAFEVMWGDYFRGVTNQKGHSAPIDRGHSYYILLEAEGADPDNDEDCFNRILESCYENGIIVDAVIPKSESERAALWNIRENFDPILEPKPVFLYDVSLPIIDMENYVNAVLEALKAQWSRCDCYVLGHIADGNLHCFIRPNCTDDHLHNTCDQIVYGVLQNYQGSISAEHGIGMEKRDWLHCSRSREELALMRSLKRMMDSKNLLNRGRVLGDLLHIGDIYGR